MYGKELPNKFDEPDSSKTKQARPEPTKEYNYLTKPNMRQIKRDIDSSSDFSD